MAADRPTLAELAARTGGRVVGDDRLVPLDVVHDSRRASPGTLFVAVRGFHVDGHDYLAAAVERGAAAVCTEHDVAVGVPALVVADTRKALGPLAAAVHGDPSLHMTVVGVTGTNGKTTVTHMLAAIGAAAGLVTGVIGTVGARIGDREIPMPRTTPEASDLQRLFATMVDDGVGLAAVEVSSHALSLGRAAATRFRVAGFTNLSQDHLDFHHTMEEYFAAKASLFTSGYSDAAVVDIDDEYGRRLAASCDLPLTTVGVDGDIRAADLVARVASSTFTLVTPAGRQRITLPLGGDFNVANALLAAGCALAAGIPWEAVTAGLEKLPPVPGRFEPVEAGQSFGVVVDYAHTPEGIRRVCEAARRLTSGRVIVVVGAGGDRDRGKRPIMGEAAARTADLVIVTSDNPRSEDPLSIIDQVLAGTAGGAATVVVEPDRRAAIRHALREAAADDVVLILGKGHERGQEIGGRVTPFDDRLVAAEELRS